MKPWQDTSNRIEALIRRAIEAGWDLKKLRKELIKVIGKIANETNLLNEIFSADSEIKLYKGNVTIRGLYRKDKSLQTMYAEGDFDRFYAKQKQGINNDIVKVVKDYFRNKDSKYTESKCIENVKAVMTKYRNSAQTIVNTANANMSRMINFNMAVEAGVKYFKYSGPPAEREFCRMMLDRVLSISEIKALKNDFGGSAWYSCGGWNCRHRWDAYIE